MESRRKTIMKDITRQDILKAIAYLGDEMNDIIKVENIKYIEPTDEFNLETTGENKQLIFWNDRLEDGIKLNALKIATNGGEINNNIIQQYKIGHIVYCSNKALLEYIMTKALEECRYAK